MNRIIRSIALALMAGLLIMPAMAQKVTKVGTTAAKFLSIPVGARALGMGGAFVGVANDASAMYWNPAGMARATQAEVQLNHAAWLADIDFNWGGVLLPVGDFGTVGVSATVAVDGGNGTHDGRTAGGDRADVLCRELCSRSSRMPRT